jgi:inner membrane protein
MVDFRLVAVGSLLPDVVDRVLKGPLGVRTRSPHQHLLGHTLIFNVPLILAGVSLLRRRRDARLASVAAASATHLLVDPVIRSPGTLFWPALGVQFPEARGLSRPLTALTQVVAALTIGAVAFNLWRSGRLPAFLTNGRF